MKILAISDQSIRTGLRQRVIDNSINLIITCGDFSYSGILEIGEID